MKTRERIKSPEQKIKEALEAKEAVVKAKEEAELFNRVFGGEDGKKALRIIMAKCHHHTPQILTSVTGLDVNGMLINAALQSHYLWLRSHINPEILREVENPFPEVKE